MKYAIISDIHANYDALKVVLDKCTELGVDNFICLGDIVGYNADPKICLKMVKELNLVGCVKGNHDEYASNNSDTMEGFNPHARKAVIWTKEQLSDEEREWLRERPMRQTIKNSNITIVHATLDSPESWGYIFDVHHAADNFAYQFTQLCFCGHSHVPISFCKKPITHSSEKPIIEVSEWAYKRNEGFMPRDATIMDNIAIEIRPGYKYLINVGSVGQPRNNDPRASFAIYDRDAQKVTRFRIPYDIAAQQAKIRAAGLPERLALRLDTGS